jgi:hypothetical protein
VRSYSFHIIQLEKNFSMKGKSMINFKVITLMVALAGVFAGGYSDVSAASQKAPLKKAHAKKPRAKKGPRAPNFFNLRVRSALEAVDRRLAALEKKAGITSPGEKLWKMAGKGAAAKKAAWKKKHGAAGKSEKAGAKKPANSGNTPPVDQLVESDEQEDPSESEDDEDPSEDAADDAE